MRHEIGTSRCSSMRKSRSEEHRNRFRRNKVPETARARASRYCSRPRGPEEAVSSQQSIVLRARTFSYFRNGNNEAQVQETQQPGEAVFPAGRAFQARRQGRPGARIAQRGENRFSIGRDRFAGKPEKEK